MSKIVIYQIFTRLFGNRNTTRNENGTIAENGCGKFADFNAKTLKIFRDMGITHVWYTGVIRHASKTNYTAYGIPAQHHAVVKGNAGSPYAITDYYDVDPDLASDVDKRMSEFEALVKRTHNAGLKMIIDFVPNHVARQYKSVCKPKGVADLGENDNVDEGFSPQNNFYYCPSCSFEPYIDKQATERYAYTEIPAKATGNDHFDNHPGMNDWYETVKLNYGVDYWTHIGHFDPIPDTWLKMTDILMFWAAKGIDGVRCDMAEMVPAAFWAYATAKVKEQYPDFIFIGEVYNPAEYRNYIHSGFDYLYDKVGMYDTLRAVTCHQCGAQAITGSWMATDDIGRHMLYFLENHDEQRIASDFFAGNGCKGVPAMIVSVLMNTNPFMLYFGEEFGERGMDKEGFSGRDGRTTIFDYWSVDTICRASWDALSDEEKYLKAIHSKVLNIANNEDAVCNGRFYDLMYANPWSEKFDANRIYTFLRRSDTELILVVANFDDCNKDVSVKIPAHAFDFLGIMEKTAKATDLLSGKTVAVELKKDCCIEVSVAARGAAVLKLTNV